MGTLKSGVNGRPSKTEFVNLTPGVNDDTGVVAVRDTKAQKNTVFYDRYQNKYKTDSLGRTVLAEGLLSNSTQTERNLTAQKKTQGKIPGMDHAGHLLAHSQGGLDAEVNLVAQDGNLNMSDYRAFEVNADNEMKKGHLVYRTVQVKYDHDGIRPIAFIVTDQIMDKNGERIGGRSIRLENVNKKKRTENNNIAWEQNSEQTQEEYKVDYSHRESAAHAFGGRIAPETNYYGNSLSDNIRKGYCRQTSLTKQGGFKMSGNMTIRDPYAMEKFASDVENYCTQMKSVCNSLKNSLSSAAPSMKDRVSKKALQRVEQLVDELLSGLPAVEGTADMLKQAAKPLKEALSLM